MSPKTSATLIRCATLVVASAFLFFVIGSGATAENRAWVRVASPTANQLNGVYCTAANNCWAVGEKGTIIHYDGTTWATVTSSVGTNLQGVFCLAANNCWAVGQDGEIAHYDGHSWSVTAQISDTYMFHSVYCSASNDCWTVGGWNKVAHYNGTSWQPVSIPANQWCQHTSISCLAANDCWAVDKLGYVSHYNGTSWSSSRPTMDQLESLVCVATNDCWAVGYMGVLRHYNGSLWATGASPTSAHLRGVSCAASNNCWAVGEGSIIHYDGTAWSSVLGGSTLRSVFCVSANDCWAVGETGTILHYMPVQQSLLPIVIRMPLPTPTPTLTPVPTPGPSPTPSGIIPLAGTWSGSAPGGISIRFTVSADGRSVSDGRVSMSCGSVSLPGPVAITNSSFSLVSDIGSIDGTFTQPDAVEGTFSMIPSEDCWALGQWSASR